MVIEVEATLNSRPLTYIAADDVEEPLTPMHLLITGRRLLGLPNVQAVMETNADHQAVMETNADHQAVMETNADHPDSMASSDHSVHG